MVQNLVIEKRQVTTQKKKRYRSMINLITQHSYFEKKTQQIDG